MITPTQQPSIYVKDFNTNLFTTYSPDEFPYDLSFTWLTDNEWSKFKRHLKMNNVNLDNLYLWCPTYSLKNRTPDYQMSITGSIIQDENHIKTLNRELGEEMGLHFTEGTLPYVYKDHYKKLISAAVDVHNTSFIQDEFNYKKYRKTTKDWFFKVSLIVYGDLYHVQKYCQTSITRLQDKSEHKTLLSACMVPFHYLNLRFNEDKLKYRLNPGMNRKCARPTEKDYIDVEVRNEKIRRSYTTKNKIKNIQPMRNMDDCWRRGG